MNPEKLRYVTRHFYDLQGLRLIPIGAIMLASGAGPTTTIPSAPPWLALGVQAAIIVAALLLFFPINRFYRERYGHVEIGSQSLRQILVLAGLLIVGFLVDIFLDFPVSAAGLGAGIFIAAQWRPRLGLRWYYALAGLGVVVGALYLGLAGMARSNMFGQLALLIFALGGTAMIFCGLLDHFTLVHMLDAAPAYAEAEGDHA